MAEIHQKGKSMTLTQLKYILAVDRARNFAQAARECFVTQPTLSMQIQKLEDTLQVKIFDRDHNPVVPTELGKKILIMAQKIIHESDGLENFSKGLRGEVAGDFHLAVIPTLAPYLLPLFLKNFEELYPKVHLKIYEYQTAEILPLIKEGKMDAALLATPLGDKKVTEEVLFFEPFKVYLSEKHEFLKKKDIKEEDLDLKEAWLLKEGHCLRTQVLKLCGHPVSKERSIFFEGGSLETLVHLVEKTQGFTILPYLATLTMKKEQLKNIREFKGMIPVREISLISGPFTAKLAIHQALKKVILKNLPKFSNKEEKKFQVLDL